MEDETTIAAPESSIPATHADQKHPRYNSFVGGVPPLPRTDWFSDLFGFAEESYQEARKWLRVNCSERPDEPCASVFLESLVDAKLYDVGIFETPSLGELRARGAAMCLPGRLTVRNELGDVAAKHAAPENRYAVFQVASQFNCLEFVGPNVTPEDGITGYVCDKTQGPACSIACGPATAFRNYFAPVDADGRVVPHSEAVQQGQTSERMIDNLVDFSELVGNKPMGRFFAIVGGYTMADERQLDGLNAKLRGATKFGYNKLLESVRVGVHRDVQVTSCNWGSKKVENSQQLLTQVFGSACAVAYNRSTRRESWQAFGSLVLEASYEATIWAALENACKHGGEEGSRRVFLTCLGGGVFGNSMSWICRAMHLAFQRFRDYDLDVRIVTYAGAIDPQLQELEAAFPPLANEAP